MIPKSNESMSGSQSVIARISDDTDVTDRFLTDAGTHYSPVAKLKVYGDANAIHDLE